MTADSSTTANLPTTPRSLALIEPDISIPPSRLYLALLTYRWLSLLPILWALLTRTGPAGSAILALFLFLLAIGSTLIVTFLKRSIIRTGLKLPFLVGADIFCAAILLLLSGNVDSPYFFYVLSSLLTAAFLLQLRNGLWALGAFTTFYTLTLLITEQIQGVGLDVTPLLIQLAGFWLITALFATLLELKQLRQAHDTLLTSHAELVQQNSDLTSLHHQLSVIYELTLFLQGASDSQSVQQRLLKAVTEELGFSSAIAGLVNPSLHRLEQWQSKPAFANRNVAGVTLSLEPEQGLITQAVLEQQVHWVLPEQELTTDDVLQRWLSGKNWLILPMIWQEKVMGVLLVAVNQIGAVNLSDDRWAILAALVSQAALALGTLNRTRHLAVEKERNRIARDIHDTMAQSLFGIAFSLDACIKLLPDQVEIVRSELAEIRAIADQVRQEVRQSILDMWPSDLTEEKFKSDLCKYVTYSTPNQEFQVEFNVEGDFNGLPAVIRRTLYRVSQEALANAARHSEAETARLYLYVEQAEVYLSIRDKGRGFDPKLAMARERNRERFGLRGMKERIEALNGTCNILSEANQGTQILVQVPLKGENEYG
jgi:signal transduction histidine kinase